jgi:hypothetical protein
MPVVVHNELLDGVGLGLDINHTVDFAWVHK